MTPALLKLPRHPVKRVALLALATFFGLAGLNHFLLPGFYVAIMPPYLPAHSALVFVSGVLEILGGLAVLLPRLRSRAGLGLCLLLVAVFPANLHMALHPELYPGLPATGLLLRLPLQFLFMAWAYWATREER